MGSIVQRFSANLKGRDFIVGDIHGAYDSVLTAMRLANFNPANDRIFSVGDLIDRGVGSFRVAKFLAQPYVHAVRGNHEDMLLELYQDGEPNAAVLEFMMSHNGFEWWEKTTTTDRQTIIESIKKLPLAIEIETERGLVGLIHADVPIGMDWATFIRCIESGDRNVIQTALWGRSRIEHGDCSGVAGIGRLFVGHTPQWGGIKQFGNVYAVDTGAIFAEIKQMDGARLSMLNAMSCTRVLNATVPDGGAVDVRDQLPSVKKPFGMYATSPMSP